jgi:hypothetical protein
MLDILTRSGMSQRCDESYQCVAIPDLLTCPNQQCYQMSQITAQLLFADGHCLLLKLLNEVVERQDGAFLHVNKVINRPSSFTQRLFINNS